MQLGPGVSAPALRKQAKGKLPKSLPSVAMAGRRYYADSILGSGTSGVVLRYRTANGETLAVKVVEGNARDAEDQACLLPRMREVMHQTRLPGSDNWGFYAMQCLPGDVLGLRSNDKQDSHTAARIVATVARGLRRLWRNGARYYDVKPGNVLRTKVGGFVLADMGSIASTASTYPPPNSLTHMYPWYSHTSGFVSSGTRAYALNCAWVLMVSFLVVSLPGRTVQLGGRQTSVSGVFAFSAHHIRSRHDGTSVGKYARRLLDELTCLASRTFVSLLEDILTGMAPDLTETLHTIGALG
jgi:hypothetical protein